MSADEYRELVTDIAEHGLVESIWLYEGKVLDGRHRYKACLTSGTEPRFRDYDGDDAIGFVLSENVKRRHLTSGQLGFIAQDVEKAYAVEARRRQVEAGRQFGAGHPKELVADLPQASPHERKSRERAAKTVGVSGRVVQQTKRVGEKAPDLAEKVKAGTMAIDRADRIVRDREAEQRRVEVARQTALVADVETLVDIRLGDFREVLTDLHDVDAIITDPPYPAEYLPLLGDLAAWADEVLAPDGVLAVLMGETHLPDVYRLLDGHRPYRWTACCLTMRAGYVSQARRVQSNWKPVLVYGGGPRFVDVIRCEGSDAGAKDNHKWGQDYGAFQTLVERLTKPGQTVVDPFCGAGTTLLAAWAQGRHAIGCDIDPVSVKTARERVGAPRILGAAHGDTAGVSHGRTQDCSDRLESHGIELTRCQSTKFAQGIGLLSQDAGQTAAVGSREVSSVTLPYADASRGSYGTDLTGPHGTQVNTALCEVERPLREQDLARMFDAEGRDD
jgi:16S rRNA G966 N2-methylase RsmD